MKKYMMISLAGLLVYMAAAALVAKLALPSGTRMWVLIGILWLVGIIAAIVAVWFLSRREKQEKAQPDAAGGAAGAESGQIDALIHEAEAKLAAARVGKIGTLPGIFLIGESGATKTSTVIHSGLEPELLAGQVYQQNTVVPTPFANLWMAGRIVIAEVGGKLLDDATGWPRLLRRLQPAKLGSLVGSGGQAPRAALLCFDIESLGGAGSSEAVVAAARKLRQKLGEVSEKLGINLPVYALFTRMDRVPFFLEYVRNLSADDARQVLGASLPLSTLSRGTGYTEQETARLNQAFDDLARSLCDARPELLAREHEASLLPAVYEFPREFRKLRPAVVGFLTELCRPSQLTMGPFLRGFYFSGIRPVIVNEVAPAPRPVQQEQAGAEIAATRMMKIGVFGQSGQAAPAPQVVGTRKVPQWVFLSHLFERVLLQDKLAMGASGSSAKTSKLRRVLLLLGTLLCLIFAIGWTVSFFKNRGLESDVRNASLASVAAAPSPMSVAPVESLRALESLRQTLAVLTDHQRYGAPFWYRWGLYVGGDLYPQVYKLYFTRFRQVMFGETQNTLLDTLRRLPATNGPEYSPTYDTLKAYLITTSNHDRSTRNFLGPVLLNRWSSNRDVDPARLELARKQFDFYADELRFANPYSSENDAAAIGKAREYLNRFGAFERIYRAMLADASKTGPPINFNRQFPGSADIIVDSYDVPSAFTKPGFAFMKGALQNPEKYFAGEAWVLGDQAVANFDRSRLAVQLTSQYYSDFVKQWRNYIKAASVNKYASIQDAAKKLGVISSNTSPLLALFWLASQNIPADVPEVANALQPVLTVVPPTNVDRYIAAPNQTYMNALVTLQASVETVAAQPIIEPATAAPTQTNATAAKVAARQVAQAFRIDPDGHLETNVQNLMEDPITYVEALIRNPEVPGMNAGGRGLCSQMSSVWSKYPFQSGGQRPGNGGRRQRPSAQARWRAVENVRYHCRSCCPNRARSTWRSPPARSP